MHATKRSAHWRSFLQSLVDGRMRGITLVASDPRRVFDADEPADAERRLPTTNGLERPTQEIERRTRVATLLPNEASLLRLASAVLSEISDDWEPERAYLTMETR